jgi:hypothetical protein
MNNAKESDKILEKCPEARAEMFGIVAQNVHDWESAEARRMEQANRKGKEQANRTEKEQTYQTCSCPEHQFRRYFIHIMSKIGIRINSV